MESKVYTYEGEQVTVRYDVKRCIHARECVSGLPQVFNPEKSPWVEPDNTNADTLATVIMHCPTGALHFDRKDGGFSEAISSSNVVTIQADGPLYMHGSIEVVEQDGTVLLKDTRIVLCRCGLSKNKPLCDNSHLEGFLDAGVLGAGGVKVGEKEGCLTVTPSKNGPLLLAGPVTIVSASGHERRQGVGAALCRCGSSQNKPFCDGSHKQVGFISG